MRKFEDINIQQVLKPSVKNRFQDFSPQDFEDFIAKVFIDQGYEVEQTSYSGDYGADLIILKDQIKTAVQIKRYSESNKVGVQEINQIIGAKSYYSCDKALFITTSSFSKQGETLANETNVELWKWENLIEVFRQIYWDGKDYYTFYEDTQENHPDKNDLHIQIEKFESMVELKGDEYGTIVYLLVENVTDKNVQLQYELPTLITKEYEQIEATYKLSTSFISGTIYSGCKVRIGYIFSYSNVKKINDGDKIVSKFHIKSGDEPEIYKQYFSIYGENLQIEDLQLSDERILRLHNETKNLEKENENIKQNSSNLQNELDRISKNYDEIYRLAMNHESAINKIKKNYRTLIICIAIVALLAIIGILI